MNNKKTTQKTRVVVQFQSTQYININIMLNSFQIKLVKFTKNEQNKNKKNSASTPCHY